METLALLPVMRNKSFFPCTDITNTMKKDIIDNQIPVNISLQ